MRIQVDSDPPAASRRRLSNLVLGSVVFLALLADTPAHAVSHGERENASHPLAALETLNGSVWAFTVDPSGGLVAGGEFTDVDGVPAAHVASFDAGWQALGAGFDAPVRALAVLDGRIVAAGDFVQSGDVVVNHVARWNGSAWEPLGTGTDGPVHALIVQAGLVLYAAGNFTQAGGLEAHSVARWIGNSWSPLGMGLEGTVHALALFNGSLIAGGEFTMRDPGQLGQNLARFNAGIWRTPALGLDGPIHALAVYQGALVMGGRFANADLVTTAFNIAALITEWNRVGFGFGPNDSTNTSVVRTLTVVENELVAGGDFELADLQAAHHVARFDQTGWKPLGAGTDSTVRALVGFDGSIVAGGDFAQAGAQPIPYVAAYNGNSWLPLVSEPVFIEDLDATIEGEFVRLRWRIAASGVAALSGVVVQRSAQSSGPFEDRSSTPLEPATAMEFIDSHAPSENWYRLVLVEHDGSTTAVGPLELRGTRAAGSLALHVPRDLGAGAPIQIEYELGSRSLVQLDLYDIRGRLVRRLESGPVTAGRHLRAWDRLDTGGRTIAHGIYVLQLRAGAAAATRKVVLVRR